MVTRFKLGNWYESRDDVRSYFGEYWKAILLKENQVAIIFNYRGARRHHYGDHLDYEKGEILYIGEGKKGDQKLNPRNLALKEAVESKRDVLVFLDCGDLFSPKRLLCAGKWRVSSFKFESHSKVDLRSVFKFILHPKKEEALEFLHFTFSAVGENSHFEKSLEVFARARAKLYSENSAIIRSRDNISGEIGEYFAIKAFNSRGGSEHLIRLSNAFKDIDAIRIKHGQRFAIKTISRLPATTSNIWSKDIIDGIDYFMICHLDPDKLTPLFVCMISSSKAQKFLRKDSHQGSHKLIINYDFLKASQFLLGKKGEWVKN